MPVDTIFIEEFLCLLLVLIGWVTPVVVAAQDSTTIEVAQPAAKTTAIKWWEAGAVVGGGLLTMAVVDGPVQEWSSNPDHYHQATDDLANAFQLFGAPAVVYPVSGASILDGLVAKKPGLFHSGLRIGASVLLAGVVTEGAKLTFGRGGPTIQTTSGTTSRSVATARCGQDIPHWRSPSPRHCPRRSTGPG
jgi:hypothetical protein